MKHTLLALALLTTLNANATWYGQGGNALTQSQSSQSISNSDSGSSNRFIAIPPVQAIAPSQSVNAICQVATPQSKARTYMFFYSESGTTGVQYNDICYAYLRGQYDVADKLMCAYSVEYKKANKDCR